MMTGVLAVLGLAWFAIGTVLTYGTLTELGAALLQRTAKLQNLAHSPTPYFTTLNRGRPVGLGFGTTTSGMAPSL